MAWNLDFISEEDFKKHVRATIMKYGEKLEMCIRDRNMTDLSPGLSRGVKII